MTPHDLNLATLRIKDFNPRGIPRYLVSHGVFPLYTGKISNYGRGFGFIDLLPRTPSVTIRIGGIEESFRRFYFSRDGYRFPRQTYREQRLTKWSGWKPLPSGHHVPEWRLPRFHLEGDEEVILPPVDSFEPPHQVWFSLVDPALQERFIQNIRTQRYSRKQMSACPKVDCFCLKMDVAKLRRILPKPNQSLPPVREATLPDALHDPWSRSLVTESLHEIPMGLEE